jgi:hypothetical protein
MALILGAFEADVETGADLTGLRTDQRRAERNEEDL